MKRTAILLVLAAALTLGSASSWALGVGDPAPGLSIKEWVANTPVTPRTAKGKVLVVEFWATWCPPCRTSIPHLNKLHETYQDKQVVICGITRESAGKVETFMKDLPMKYHVGVDTGKTFGAYMQGIGGIPHAFVVAPNGKVTWHGHPMGGLDKAIEAALEASPGAAKPLDTEGMEPVEAALKLSTTDNLPQRDLEKALEIARKAYYGSGRKSATALAALARVHYEMGHLELAYRAAEKAAELAEGDAADELKAVAEYYRREHDRRRKDPAAKL